MVLAYQIGYLSNSIPVPGGIGVLDCSLIGMLVLYGVGGTVATAATLAYHAVSLWVPAVWGTIASFSCRRRRGTGRRPQPDRGTEAPVPLSARPPRAVEITTIRRGRFT